MLKTDGFKPAFGSKNHATPRQLLRGGEPSRMLRNMERLLSLFDNFGHHSSQFYDSSQTFENCQKQIGFKMIDMWTCVLF